MAIPKILAMTAEEIRNTAPLPPNIAFLGCHFTSDGAILLPGCLPTGCGLILDDRAPIPEADLCHLTAQLQALSPRFLILDFQRPAEAAAERLVHALTGLPCPTIIPPQYAEGNARPVFLPPIPPHIPAEEYLKPWRSREVWLELALDATEINVTTSGSVTTALTHAIDQSNPHRDSMLHCHYKISIEPDSIRFYCYRRGEDINELLHSLLPPNVTHAVGLFQELGK